MAGDISHIEFPADDVERAKRFYGAVAGWDFSTLEGFPTGFSARRRHPVAGSACAATASAR
jgi:predicted enzyme related to lactoylglutathione lyase